MLYHHIIYHLMSNLQENARKQTILIYLCSIKKYEQKTSGQVDDATPCQSPSCCLLQRSVHQGGDDALVSHTSDANPSDTTVPGSLSFPQNI